MRTIKREEACELLLVNRNYLYQLFYKAFAREPDLPFLAILTGENTGESFALLGGEVLEEVPMYLEKLRKDLREPDLLERLKEEYNRLFVGPVQAEAPPWESVYVGKPGMLFQESTLKVRECYRRFGLLPKEVRRVADDSLALELGFMAELSQRSVDAFEGGNIEALYETLQGAMTFLTDHLLIWVPELRKKAGKTKTNLLYPGLFSFLDSFLSKDAETLYDLLSEGANAHDRRCSECKIQSP